MTAPFVTGLRSRNGTICLSDGPAAITIRVEMPDVWDVVRIAVDPAEHVVVVKVRALQALYPQADASEHADFVVKLHGWEILDEAMSLTDAGAVDGSILLLTFRRRRPVR